MTKSILVKHVRVGTVAMPQPLSCADIAKEKMNTT